MDIKNNWWEDLDSKQCQTHFRMTRLSIAALQAELQCLEDGEHDYTKTKLQLIDKQLLATLWFLGHADSNLSQTNKNLDVIENTLQRMLHLGNEYISWPTEEEAKEIEKTFEEKHNCRDIIGVLGSVYISLNNSNISQEYYNKQTREYMIVLQAVCDSNLLFRDVCVGCPGSYSVKNILLKSPLYSKLTDNNSYLVKNEKHLFGGTQHPKLKTLLTPYSGKELTNKQHEFNIMHSRITGDVEQAFKCLRNRFPRVTSVDGFDPEFVSLIIAASCILHNFTRIRNDTCELYV